jgi:carbon-monoxide dehydrogenase small subunit
VKKRRRGAAVPEPADENLRFTLNGRETSVRIDPSRTLLEVLRYDCGLTGTKEGCSKGECGACTVLMDGRPVDSCLVMARQAEGAEVTTVEGLADRWRARTGRDDALHPVQRAFIECGGAQCGICTPGFIVAAAALLERNPRPTHDETVKGLEGNLCRCTGYIKIFEAVRRAADLVGR